MPAASARCLRPALIAVFWLWLWVLPGFATNTISWYSRSWQSDEGLPNNTISGIAQTPDGYLWLGTPSGLARFDGIQFEEFSPTNFIGPPNRGAIAMMLARNGALWLALDRGAVVRLQAGESRVYAADLPDAIPNGMAEDAQGAIWAAYRSGEVFRIHDSKVARLTDREGLPPGRDICALASDSGGRIWFAKGGEFGTISNGMFTTIHRIDSAPSRLAASKAGGVWLLSGFRVFKAQPNGDLADMGEFRPERGGTIGTVLLEDREGALWIGTSFSGLLRRGEFGFETVGTSHAEIISLAEDREGNLWVGTGGGGLNCLRRRAITLESLEAGLPYAAVQSICEDAGGTIWAATRNGTLARRSAGRWTALTAADGWPEDATCVTADGRGRMWIGTRLHGLTCWQDGRFVSWGNPAELRGETLHTLLVSRRGDLWIGEETPHAIQRLRDGKLHTFAVPQDCRVIRAMTEDAAGTIWAGTSKGMLFRVSGEEIKEVNLRPADELASIRCLSAAADGTLRIGYAGWGIGSLKEGRYTEIGAGQGLFDNYISHLVSDGRGWLWFGANRGIFRVSENDLADVAAGRSQRVRSFHYGRSQGLPSLQGTFGDCPDVLRSRDGRLWIPMRTGLAVVHPEWIEESLEPPPTLLNRVSVDDQIRAWYGGILPGIRQGSNEVLNLNSKELELRLPPQHRRLEFHFAAMSFTAPENVQFRYRLEGFDEGWIEAGSKRMASYSRLSAGDYLFQVAASDASGEWSRTPATLRFQVAPFFYHTWWFRLMVLGVFTLSVIAVVRYVSFRRLHRQLRALEELASLHKERARIAKDIHDDLGANLTQIALLGDLARQDQTRGDRAAERIATISATARQAIKSLDEIVWAVNPRNDTLAHLLDYAGQFALDYLRLAGIRCRIDFPGQPPPRELSTDIRHNVFLAIKEALHNIVKHSGATEVWFRAVIAGDHLELRVEDNGKGFVQPPDDALADGLRNMRQRLGELGGNCDVASRPGSGTTVSLRLPWPHE